MAIDRGCLYIGKAIFNQMFQQYIVMDLLKYEPLLKYTSVKMRRYTGGLHVFHIRLNSNPYCIDPPS